MVFKDERELPQSDGVPTERSTRADTPEIELKVNYALTQTGGSISRGVRLAWSVAVTTHAAAVAKAFEKFFRDFEVRGTLSLLEGARAEAQILLRKSNDNSAQLLDPCASEMVVGFVEDLALTTHCLATSDEAARMVGVTISGPVKLIEATTPMKALSMLDEDFNVVVARSPLKFVPRFKKTMAAAGKADALGIKISFQLGKKKIDSPAIREDAMKPAWHASSQENEEADVTGFLKRKRCAELTINKRTYEIAVSRDDAEILTIAAKSDSTIKATIEYACPSNPCLVEKPRLKLVEVRGIVATPVQEELDINDDQLD